MKVVVRGKFNCQAGFEASGSLSLPSKECERWLGSGGPSRRDVFNLRDKRIEISTHDSTPFHFSGGHFCADVESHVHAKAGKASVHGSN